MLKKKMFNFILCFCLHTDKNLTIYPSIHTHQYTLLDYIIYLLPRLVHFMSLLYNIHTETNVLLMCIDYKSILMKSYCIFCLTEMFQQLHFLRFEMKKKWCVFLYDIMLSFFTFGNHAILLK